MVHNVANGGEGALGRSIVERHNLAADQIFVTRLRIDDEEPFREQPEGDG